jgi:hypothetical protein
VACAAERAGTTAHNFILEAIAEKADQAERMNEFHETAQRRFEQIASSGKTIPWTEMRSYLEARLAGKKPRRPAARKLAR